MFLDSEIKLVLEFVDFVILELFIGELSGAFVLVEGVLFGVEVDEGPDKGVHLLDELIEVEIGL